MKELCRNGTCNVENRMVYCKCFKTVQILFVAESTEGVEEGQTTAMSGEKEQE